MSGQSTLRICLAAMAPALTEAASARLRLQDTSDSERKNSKTTFQTGDTRSSISHRPSDIPRALSVTGNDFKVLGSRIRSKGEGRVTHLSKLEGPELDPKVSSVTHRSRDSIETFSASSVSKTCDPTIPSPNAKHSITRFSTSSIIPKSNIDIFLSEDFQESSIVPHSTASLLQNLKIMNQPATGTDKIEEPSLKVSDGSDTSRNLTWVEKSSEDVTFDRRMVNGDTDGSKRRGSRDSTGRKCDERGDAQPQNTPSSAIRRSVHFSDSEDPVIQTKKPTKKMGVSCAGRELAPSALATLSSVAGSSSELLLFQLQALETMDAKSRDEVRKECTRKQAHLERRVETLLRRLKRIRGKVTETHSREQLRQFVNFQHRSLQHVAKVMRSEAPGPAELKEHFLSNDEVKSMSTTELVKLVRTYQPLAASAQHHSLAASNQRGISHSLTRLGGPFSSAAPVVVMDPALRGQCAEVSERLGHRVVTASAELDSDATASSSGGESGDDEVETPPWTPARMTDGAGSRPKVAPDLPSLVKRAEWRWATDRAAIVSRWTWLQAQVSDLEYRIRQQSQVHRQLRASKGGVVLGDPPSTTDILRQLHGLIPTQTGASEVDTRREGDRLLPGDGGNALEASPCNIQAVMSNVDKQASRLSQSLGNCLSPASSASASTSVVGSPRVASLGSSPGRSPAQARDGSPSKTAEGGPSVPTELSLVSRTSDLFHSPENHRHQNGVTASSSLSLLPPSSSALDASCQAARCRPLRSYRKRRILRTLGLHLHSHKAARLSDVRCRCSPPGNSCPMCGGRRNNTLPMDADMMALRERVALLDASFHPVLSFPEDIALPVHCEGMLKTGLWQNKPLAKRSRGAHHHSRGRILLAGDYRYGNGFKPQKNSNNKSTNSLHLHHQDKVLTLVMGEGRLGDVGRKRSKKKGVTASIARQNGKNNTAVVASTASVIKNFSEKIKNKYESKTKSRKANSKAKPLAPRNKKVKRKTSKMTKEALKKKRRRQAEAEEDDDFEALYLEQEVYEADGELGCGLSTSASQSSLKELSQQHHRNRRRVDNSYDINNIVIPLSMATSVPVEQPQYKEIVTPKWREKPVPRPVVSGPVEDLATQLEKTNGVALSGDQHRVADQQTSPEAGVTDPERDEEDKEDLSDERFAQRHLPLELEEKKRFRNFVQYPPLRRSRARSDVSLSAMDSRSVDRGDGIGSEENSMSSRPTTPILMKSLPSMAQSGVRGSSLEETLATLSQQQRARAMSVSTPTRRDQRAGSVTESLHDPWPTRVFPLQQEEYETMLEAAGPKPCHQHNTRFSHSPKQASQGLDVIQRDTLVDRGTTEGTTELEDGQSIVDSVALSPQSASASASVSSTAGDDPADPEWIGGADGGPCSNASSSGSSGKRGRGRRILDDPSDPEWLGSDFSRKNKNKR